MSCSKSKSSGAPPGSNAGGYEISELRYQGFSGMVTYPELAEDLGYLAPLHLRFVGMTISGPQDIQSVVTGDVDFGGAFNGAIIKLIAANVNGIATAASETTSSATQTAQSAEELSRIASDLNTAVGTFQL